MFSKKKKTIRVSLTKEELELFGIHVSKLNTVKPNTVEVKRIEPNHVEIEKGS